MLALVVNPPVVTVRDQYRGQTSKHLLLPSDISLLCKEIREKFQYNSKDMKGL